ncbi:MAG TPA: peptidoglycan DD-metalloendopeptidase family protein [Woeseiaceae bacterium]
MKHRCTLSLLAALATVSLLRPGLAQEDGLAQIKEQELEEVRERISELKDALDKRAAERDRISADLQTAEAKASEKRLQIQELERQKAYSEKRIEELDGRRRGREAELEEEINQLSAQVRAAYTSGSQERIKLLLNQHDPASLGRLMTYYRYVSDHRRENIDAVTLHLEELAGLRQEAAAEQERLGKVTAARQAELSALDAAQEERQQLLAALKTRMQEAGAEMERLAAQEQDLARLIIELSTILADYPITSEEPFTSLRGQLTWPVAGQLVHDFGQPRAGGAMNWNGVVLAAPRGREVRAVYHGRVIFADWLDGMGLLVIVDHGESFMTLYGYNETTLKSAGDWVAPGDAIATVGESGGQADSGLYFEIRQGTKPVNPRTWVTRQPRAR